MKPKVSVNITTWNRAGLLPRCLDSVLRQTYENLEIVVVDDGSDDDTEAVVARYREKDPRIAYVRHGRNRGNAAARNTALEHSSGEYVAFLDDDDEWIDPEKIARQVALMEKLPDRVAIVCSGVQLVDRKGRRREKRVRHPEDLRRHILRENGIIYSPTVLTRRRVMEEVGGFDEKMPRGVDSEYYRTCIVRYGYGVHFMEEVTTAVHEYGPHRMSPVEGRGRQLKIMRAHARLVRKYAAYLLRYPSSLFHRLAAIAKSLVKIVLYPFRKRSQS